MKTTTAVRMVLVIALGCIVFSGCGGGSEEDAETPASVPEDDEASAEDEAAGTVTATPSDGSLWTDVPVYATATQLQQQSSWSIPLQAESDYERMEWRYYELPSDHSIQMVSSFYKMEMPKNGWQQMMEMEVEDAAILFYSKDDEKDAAYVWVGREDGKTAFALMRAAK